MTASEITEILAYVAIVLSAVAVGVSAYSTVVALSIRRRLVREAASDPYVQMAGELGDRILARLGQAA